MGCASSTDVGGAPARRQVSASASNDSPYYDSPPQQQQQLWPRAQLREFHEELDRNPAHAPAVWVATTSLLAAHLAQATVEAESYRSAESGGIEAAEPPADDVVRRQVKARAAAFFHHGIDGDPEQFADAIRDEQAELDARAVHLPAETITEWREAVADVDAQSRMIELVTPRGAAGGTDADADERHSLPGTPQSSLGPSSQLLLRPSGSVSWNLLSQVAANPADLNASQRSFGGGSMSQIMIEVTSPRSGEPTPKQQNSFLQRSPNSYHQPTRNLSSSGRHRSPTSPSRIGSAVTAQSLAQLPSLRCPAAPRRETPS